MPATIYLVTGGCRSGKSSYAERLCEELSDCPIYLATAASASSRKDPDFVQRIKKHQQDREKRKNCTWTTIEEPLKPSQHENKFLGKVVLLDCMTLWLTNWMMEEGAFTIVQDEERNSSNNNKDQVTAAVERSMKNLQQEFDILTIPYNVTFVVVTNEVGSGTHADSHLSRKFVDAQGWCNQFVARKAQQVIYMVAGMPHILKNELDQQSTNRAVTEDRTLKASRLDRYLSSRNIPMDGKGYFLVKTDEEKCLILASFHSCILNDKGEVCDLDGNKISCHGESPEPLKVWKCRTAKELTVEIFEKWDAIAKLGLSVGHAAYIGREAQKAEHSLYHIDTGSYQQD